MGSGLDLDEDRLWRAEAHNSIVNLEGAYARTWDTADAAGWAALFTGDGIFERVDVPGKPGRRKQGRRELEDFCRDFNVGWGRVHMIHSYEIDVDGESASSRLSFECRRILVGDHPCHGITTGFYDVDYVFEGGRWLIAHRRERQVFYREESYFGVC